MEFLNFLINLSSPEQKMYEEFKKLMEEIFSNVFDESWMRAANNKFENYSKDTMKI